MTTDFGFCPYPKCRRRLFSVVVDGDVATIAPLHAGRLQWTTQSALLETWDTVDVFCRRHGHADEIGIDVVKFNYHCSTINVVEHN